MPYRRGSKWVAQIKMKGVNKRTKFFDSKKEAIKWEAQQQEMPKELWKKQIGTNFLNDWANDYLEFAKSKFSTKTYDEKRGVFSRFFRTFDCQTPVDELTKGQVLTFLLGQHGIRSGYAVNKDRKNLVAAWNWGIKYRGMPLINPCLVDRFPEKRQTRYIPPEGDFWAVYDVAEGQDKVMLLSYLHLAARRNELFRLKWEDVDFVQCKVRLWTRKRADSDFEYEWLPMTDDLFTALLQHKKRCLNEWVFPEPATGRPYLYRQHWMKRVCRRAGVRPFGLHAIRHLTASILAQANVAMVQIQAILRHKNLATTERYIKRLDDLKTVLRVLSRGKGRLAGPFSAVRTGAENAIT